MQLNYSATIDTATAQERLDHLLVPGPLLDRTLHATIERVARVFAGYASSYPLPLWAPHLVLTPEMRATTEALFPLAEVRSAFRRLLLLGCRFPPLLETTLLYTAPSWLDVLQGSYPWLREASPAPALARLAEDGDARRDFLFALFLPERYGPSFERYPRQAQWLSSWLREERARLAGKATVLDCACGSGEGTYRLAELIMSCGFEGGKSTVHGSTFEPIELFAAAHARFPHDPRREESYRERIAPLLTGGSAPNIAFYLEEVASEGERGYDVILCNGLLGGPMLSGREEVALALSRLSKRLAPGGVLLAADRFHAGWKKLLSNETMSVLMRGCGLNTVPVPEGIAGVRR